MIELIKAIIIGIVQGISEWLPISSTGHLIIFNSFFPMEISQGGGEQTQAFWGLFLVVIQLASIAAVIILYFKKLNPLSFKKTKQERVKTMNLWLRVFIASLPSLFIGLAINDWVEAKMQTAIVVAIALIFYGILFILLENRKHKSTIKDVESINLKTAFFIGAFQTLAMIPGTSRSGATILGASYLGCSRKAASEFSFFCAIPAMVGVSALRALLYFLDYGFDFSFDQILILSVSSIVAFVVSVISIKYFTKYIENHDFKVFGYYRIILGVALILCFVFGMQMYTNV